MKLYYIGISKVDEEPDSSKPNGVRRTASEIVSESDLSSFGIFQRSNIGQFMTFFAKTVSEGTQPGRRQDVEEQNCTFHAYGRTEGICGIIITDQDYPSLVAHQVLSKVVDEFLSRNPRSSWANGQHVAFPELKEYITKYQDPHAADSIMKIQKELDETKITLHKTIESVLQRGEKLDSLVERSNDLSKLSKDFYKTAKKQNSCCVVM